jgi:hypothetical protein
MVAMLPAKTATSATKHMAPTITLILQIRIL